MKKLLYILFSLAILFLYGFTGWALSCHGTIGCLRLNPVFLYILVGIDVGGIVLTGLFVLYLRRNRTGKGRLLYVLIVTVSVICILLFPYAFTRLAGIPRANDIPHLTRLKVPQVQGSHLHFAVGSDAHFGAGTNNPAATTAMLDQINDPANNYTAFFYLGDLVEYGFADDHWREALQTLSPVASSLPLLFAPGNHDTLFGGLQRYIDYCSPPETASPLWQRVDTGTIHFLLLDVEWSAESFTPEQANWLETQLKSIPEEDWIIVMSHGFYYSSGITIQGWDWFDNPETITALTPLFEKYGVDLVFSGHNHHLEFLQHAGVSYVICGGFGGKPEDEATYISPSSLWYQSGAYGFVDVYINGDRATISFIAPDANILNSFTIERH